ncbi:MAG: NADH-quinone oxidoreductase subunit L [Thermoplasmata archaeon]
MVINSLININQYVIAAFLIFLVPIIMFPLILLIGKFSETGKRISGILATAGIFISFILSWFIYSKGTFSFNPGDYYFNFEFPWFGNITWGVFVDPLAITMALMVSGVSFLIHMFAIGYMGKDPNKHVYFAETSLFTGGMLGLVLSANLVMFFLFWELVGLCSYLLIGFWYFKPNAASAAKKAFIVTRVGDVLLILGLAVLYWMTFSSNDPLSIYNLNTQIPLIISRMHSNLDLAIAGALILGGVAGKSSQFPLHVWIPDAMEGPTTVSALIHAATMVTAGIYLVARIYPIYLYALPWAGLLVLYIGAFTAFLAGTIGIVVNDVKRILAYSTISQLGYMLAALGVGIVLGESTVGYSLYHLVVHAFLKALLFLSAGSILFMLLDVRDIRKMGGLWKKMPITISAMFIGALTLIGFPPLAGYFSKDAIISMSYYGYLHNTGLFWAWFLLLIGAFLTTVYTFRMFFVVALGKPKSYAAENAKDPPWVMIIPLIVLSGLSIIYGLFQTDFYNFFNGVYQMTTMHFDIPWYIEWLPFILVLFGLLVAYLFYASYKLNPDSVARKSGIFYRIVKNKYYLDVLFTNIIAERFMIILAKLFYAIDKYVVDGIVNGVGIIFRILSEYFRKIQTGIVQYYAAMMLAGLIAILITVFILIGGI